MRHEPMPEDDGYRVWLSPSEEEKLIEYYEEEPRKQLALELMLFGLRSDEVINVTRGNIRELESEEEAYKIEIQDGKTGYRQTPISRETKQKIHMLANARGLRKDQPLIDVSRRTVQRWLNKATEHLSQQNNNWNKITCHDLRRTWATNTYYQLNASDVAKSVVMRWGGWVDQDTFETNYLGREPDWLAADLMEKANLR